MSDVKQKMTIRYIVNDHCDHFFNLLSLIVRGLYVDLYIFCLQNIRENVNISKRVVCANCFSFVYNSIVASQPMMQ